MKSKNNEKLKALDKIRRCRLAGEKHEYEPEEDKSVYTYVDEETYQKEVNILQDTSWIVGTYNTDAEVGLTPKKVVKAKQLAAQSVVPIANLFTRKVKDTSMEVSKDALQEIEKDELLGDILKSLSTSHLERKPTTLEQGATDLSPTASPIVQTQKKIVMPISTPKIEHNTSFKEVKMGIKIPSFDFSDLSNDFSDIEAQVINQNLTFSLLSAEHSFNRSVNLSDVSIPIPNIKDENATMFYLIDIADSKAHPNSVFLFGKVKVKNDYVSCMVHVKNTPNQFFVLPRSSVIY